jgi:Glycine zipper 2TM domain
MLPVVQVGRVKPECIEATDQRITEGRTAMSKLLTRAALALSIPGLMLAATSPAQAHDRDDRGWRTGGYDDDYRGNHWRDDRGRYRDRGYYRDRDRAYAGPVWRGRDGRYYCRRDDGTTGLLIGAAAGGLLGREVAGPRGDRTAGLIIGAAAGALLGRAVDRGDSRCR